jgi:selenocysteine lyase/cysteine desulfurase
VSGALSDHAPDTVGYAADGSRFLGATFDASGLHRLAAVFDWMERIGLSVPAIHDHVMALQSRFIRAVDAAAIEPLRVARLITPMGTTARGHFLCYETPQAAAMQARLAAANIVTDVRGDRIRFGFGCYHTEQEIDAAVVAMARALAP